MSVVLRNPKQNLVYIMHCNDQIQTFNHGKFRKFNWKRGGGGGGGGGTQNKKKTLKQGCCLTGARSPGAPKLRVRATKFLFKEPGWAPKHRFSILI